MKPRQLIMAGVKDGQKLVLASTSPRRKELLHWMGLPFQVLKSGVDEYEPPEVDPRLIAEDLALQKARAVAETCPDALVIGADTVVAVDGVSLGKPVDKASALLMLERLKGRDHEVITGVAVVARDRTWHGVVVSRVTMRDTGSGEIEKYVATSEPYDKAGGYALQGHGGALVERVQGCMLAVVGFPVCLVNAFLHGRESPGEQDVHLCAEAAAANYPGRLLGSHAEQVRSMGDGRSSYAGG